MSFSVIAHFLALLADTNACSNTIKLENELWQLCSKTHCISSDELCNLTMKYFGRNPCIIQIDNDANDISLIYELVVERRNITPEFNIIFNIPEELPMNDHCHLSIKGNVYSRWSIGELIRQTSHAFTIDVFLRYPYFIQFVREDIRNNIFATAPIEKLHELFNEILKKYGTCCIKQTNIVLALFPNTYTLTDELFRGTFCDYIGNRYERIFIEKITVFDYAIVKKFARTILEMYELCKKYLNFCQYIDKRDKELLHMFIDDIRKSPMLLCAFNRKCITKEMWLAGTQSLGGMLQYVPKSMQTPEMCINAVENDASANWGVKIYVPELQSTFRRDNNKRYNFRRIQRINYKGK